MKQLITRRGRLIACLLAGLAAGCATSTVMAGASGCTADDKCRFGRVCVAGGCEEPLPAAQAGVDNEILRVVHRVEPGHYSRNHALRVERDHSFRAPALHLLTGQPWHEATEAGDSAVGLAEAPGPGLEQAAKLGRSSIALLGFRKSHSSATTLPSMALLHEVPYKTAGDLLRGLARAYEYAPREPFRPRLYIRLAQVRPYQPGFIRPTPT